MVAFNHNDYYHRLLLRHMPWDCRRVLDVGCGTGRFARRLASRGITVDAIDASPLVIRHALAQPSSSARFWHADITTTPLPDRHYDAITCLASLHHMPFATVARLRAALAPGGVLLVLGCYREQWPADAPLSLAAVPLNAAARLTVAARDRMRTRPADTSIPTAPAEMSLAEVRRHAAALLPGATVRRLLFWRYLLWFQR